MIKMYTQSNDTDVLKKVDNDGGIFTSDEHAFVSKLHHDGTRDSYTSIIEYFFREQSNKLKDIHLLKELIGSNQIHLLSLGAGCCTVEHFLQYALPAGSRVTATDFDHYHIEVASKYFTNITSKHFDFFHDQIADLGSKPDVAMLLKSGYVMDDAQYISLLKDLKDNGVKKVIDICGGVMTFKEWWQHYSPFSLLKRSNLVRKLMGKPSLDSLYKGKFHGYMRTKSELREIYRKTSPKSVKEMTFMTHKYIAIIEY